MSNYIFTKEDRNEFKIAMALLHKEDISWLLRRFKIQEMCCMLGYGELDEDEGIFDSWVSSIEFLLDNRDYDGFKKYLLKELLYLEAYSEIVDFGLEKIKLDEKV